MLNGGVAALLFTAFSAAAAERPPYHWLTTTELEQVLRGSRIVEDRDIPSWMKTPEEFRQDGWLVRYADNYEAHGRFVFRDNAVCDQELGKVEVCRRVLVDKHGRYWIVNRWAPSLLVKIAVKPIR